MSDTLEMVARRSYGKLVAYLAARTRDVAAAEDALSEAFAAALTGWPRDGVPQNPEAWLLTVARRKWIDQERRRKVFEMPPEPIENTDIPDRRLGLLFACAHPAIDAEVRAPLMLQTVLGFDAKTIAGLFLTSPEAMGKRLVRAKSKIRLAGIPFQIPEKKELPGRVKNVLDAIYATFSEGWKESRDWSEEAVFLARVVADLLRDEPEVIGLLALMLYVEARRAARRQNGEYVPFEAQNTALWDWRQIAEAEALLRRAGTLGRYQLEAAIQSAHIERRRSGRPNWPEVVALYDALAQLTESPVVAVNRALAVAEAEGAEAGLAALERVADKRLETYQPYWAARAELLARTGADAREAYRIAIDLERDPAVRRFLERRSESR